MNTEVQKQVEGIIPTLNRITLENSQLSTAIMEKEMELKQSPLYIELNNLKNTLRDNEAEEVKLREQGKEMMISNGLKEFEMLDGTIVALHNTPGALVVEEGATFNDKYYRIKKELDKAQIKRDFNAGVPIEGVYIEKDYKFIIRQK